MALWISRLTYCLPAAIPEMAFRLKGKGRRYQGISHGLGKPGFKKIYQALKSVQVAIGWMCRQKMLGKSYLFTLIILLTVLKSQRTTWDVFETLLNNRGYSPPTSTCWVNGVNTGKPREKPINSQVFLYSRQARYNSDHATNSTSLATSKAPGVSQWSHPFISNGRINPSVFHNPKSHEIMPGCTVKQKKQPLLCLWKSIKPSLNNFEQRLMAVCMALQGFSWQIPCELGRILC